MADPASLPLPDQPALASPTPDAKLVPTEGGAPKVPSWKARPTSKVRKICMKILALRLRGMKDAEIGELLNLSVHTVHTYMYRAGKNGWLVDIEDPKDRVEFDLMHKVVRNMGEALDSADDERRDKMTLEVAKGALFPRFVAQGGPALPTNMLAVQIIMPEGAVVPTVRDGTVQGAPSFVEGESIDATPEPSPA